MSRRNNNFIPNNNSKVEEDDAAEVVAIHDQVETKTLDVENTTDAKEKINDIVIKGNPDIFQLVYKASSKSQGWMKSTKACNVWGGCIIQVSTQQRNPDGTYAVSEAVTFAPHISWDKKSEIFKRTY